MLVVRAPGGGPLDIQSPKVRHEVDRLSAGVAKADYVGRVVNPLRDRRAGAELIAHDGRSLVIVGNLSTGDDENAGGIAAEQVQPAVEEESKLDVSMGGYAPASTKSTTRPKPT